MRCSNILLFFPCRILSKDHFILKTLGNSLPYEVTVGMNGRIWVKGRSHKETVAIVNAICSSEYMSADQIQMMCRKLVDALAGF